MKKPIKIDENLHKLLKSRATLQGITLTEMVETILNYANKLDDLHKSLLEKGLKLYEMSEKLQKAQEKFQKDISDKIEDCLGPIEEDTIIFLESEELDVDDLLDMVKIYGNDILTDEEKRFLDDNI